MITQEIPTSQIRGINTATQTKRFFERDESPIMVDRDKAESFWSVPLVGSASTVQSPSGREF